jgi:hypothetical protein
MSALSRSFGSGPQLAGVESTCILSRFGQLPKIIGIKSCVRSGSIKSFHGLDSTTQLVNGTTAI